MLDYEQMTTREKRARYGPVGSGEYGFLRGLGYYVTLGARETLSGGLNKVQTYSEKLRDKFTLPKKYQWPAALFGGGFMTFSGYFLDAAIVGRNWSNIQTLGIIAGSFGMLGGSFLVGRAYECLSATIGKGIPFPEAERDANPDITPTDYGIIVPPPSGVWLPGGTFPSALYVPDYSRVNDDLRKRDYK